MQVAELKRQLSPGSVWAVTNHHITREDHPCYGTQVRTVTKANSAAYYFDKGGRLAWPKASEIEEGENGSLRIYGHPKVGDLFLTLIPQ